MAKTKHHNILDTVDELFTDAKNKKVMLLKTEDEILKGRLFTINGKTLCNFGTLGYMGLEQHELLKQAAIEAIIKFGVQFSASRAYLSIVLIEELEYSLSQLFEKPVLVSSTSTSLGHIGIIPSVIHDEDAIILDHQVHASIQNAVELVRKRGVPIEIIRHNDLEMLEDTIKRLGPKHRKIWYMIDGVYSMYGDFPPIHELVKMLKQFEQLHLYIDDAHGVSWAGKNGCGYTLSQIDFHDKMILASTMGKAFGVGGGIFAFPNQEIWRKLKTFGGALSFSVPATPPVLAAALASAKIHLSDEIYLMQNELAAKINYCNQLIKKTILPLMADNCSPIFFIATGTPSTGYNLMQRIMNEGYFVNLAIFPAVSVKNTGIRFSISRHITMEDIKGLVEVIDYHLPKVLEEEGRSYNEVRKAFKMPLLESIEFKSEKEENIDGLIVERYKTIREVNEELWNVLLGTNGSFDWEGLKFLEDVYSKNEKPEENWSFNYVIIKDKKGDAVLATFYTSTLWKEDMLSLSYVSMKIEEHRKQNPYYLTSMTVFLGSFLTEGNHLYLSKTNPLWKSAFFHLIKLMQDEQEKVNATSIVLRDFETNDEEVKHFLIGQGFVNIDMPESCVIENLTWNNKDEFRKTLSANSKRHLKKEVFNYEHFFNVEVKDKISKEELNSFYNLYLNVKNRNFDLNVFEHPFKLFKLMNENPNWEFIILYLKPEFDFRPKKLAIAVVFCYKGINNEAYTPMLIGMDYNFASYNIYRQALYQITLRAKYLNYKRINLGLSANTEKKKFGARIIPKVAYIQAKDNFNMELIGLISAEKDHSIVGR